MSSPIALIFGAGSRVGAAATTAFLKAGYRVARISRSQDSSDNTSTLLNISADLIHPESVETIFATVRKAWGEPSVVLYNAYYPDPTPMSGPSSTFSVPTGTFTASLAVNVTSPFVAIREALASFRSPSAAPGPKTFLFTGNVFNQGTLPGFLTLGVGKAGATWMVECADAIFNSSAAAGASGRDESDIRFHYLDERHDDGTPMFTGLGGQAHAEAFLGLAERREGWKGLGWLVTFVSGAEGEGGNADKARFKGFRRGLILPQGM